MAFIIIHTEDMSERKGYYVSRKMPEDYAIVYFDPTTGKYARGTLQNYYSDGAGTFVWKDISKLKESMRTKIALLQMFDDLHHNKYQSLPDIGGIKLSKFYKGFIVYKLRDETWKKN